MLAIWISRLYWDHLTYAHESAVGSATPGVRRRCDLNRWFQALASDGVFEEVWAAVLARTESYIAHIRRIGEEKLGITGEKTHPARRWVVERTLACLSKCRRILARNDKKPENFKGLIQLACALLWGRRPYASTGEKRF